MRNRGGQAVAEFAVAVFSLTAAALAVFAVSALVRADSDAMRAARAAAAAASARRGAGEADFPFVSSVDSGPDGMYLTPDDARNPGFEGSVREGVARRFFRNGGEGPLSSIASPDGAKSGKLAGYVDGRLGSGAAAYALRKGEGSADAAFPPVVRALFGIPEKVRFHAQTWMPATGGLD